MLGTLRSYLLRPLTTRGRSHWHAVPSRALVAVAERPAGPGGVQKRTERVVPSEAARQERTARLRRAVDLLQNRIYPFLEQKVAGEAERKDLLAVLEQDSSRFEDERAIRDWVESQIQEAIRQGAFERLPRGPLQLPQPPLGVDLVTYTMHGLLQRHGLRPVWIECMHEVDAEVKRIRLALERAYRARVATAEDTSPASTAQRAERWEAAARELQEQMHQVNRRIDAFNLMKPERLDTVFRLRMRWEHEFMRVKQRVESEYSAEPRSSLAPEATDPKA
ncbi:hypothetical protein CYME_CMM252C [Cyanidioschyzon merolae strain 10D]|jgi:hypothetical protein|uniref:DnaJ homologue subfamily C member 28 conserved domain-containing protein n=1 Tax=Cyanidioschyzon merolae (strain NIES-3377 / 10D) TaxID=280699 RepID=M1VDY7_CYAM1|nr:hypothetical protein CYME_CMM252C [Cyanidioschyzon merolae strain 10D]BAM81087.1 hypothetical protein CYME_CMM252C [Cyanidioschyzon merolae strain 10D]|eukprot:XP_005537123.1 hypothetical protein CYME_CMM252C [Cyanidioschyzon merolae strain 10D]